MGRKNVTDKQVVKACKEFRENKRFPLEALMALTGECEKVCFRAMERAQDRGFIECGVSVRTSWPTDEGLTLLNEPKS